MYYFYKIAHFLAQVLPVKISYGIATFLAKIYYYLPAKGKNNLSHNLGVVFGGEISKKRINEYTKKGLINFSTYLVDFLRLTNIPKNEMGKRFRIKGRENLDAAVRRGKGTIVLSSHLGHWELGGGIFTNTGNTIYAITLDHTAKKVNNFFIAKRASFGMGSISHKSALKKCIKVLRQNQLLAILADRDTTNGGIPMKFFGRETLVPKGASFFALKTGAAILPSFVIKDNQNNITLFLEKPIIPVETGDLKENMHDIINTYMEVIERFIKRFPDQWYVFEKIWKTP